MPKDFAKNSRSGTTKKKNTKPRARTRTNSRKKPATKKAPLWAWVVMGLMAAALVTLLIYLANQSSSSAPVVAEAEAEPKPKPAELKKEDPQPRFDFYEILKQQKVEVPDRSAEVEEAASKRPIYFLQVASFRSQSDAEALRAELILLNMPADIEIVNNNQNTWYRVVAGPFKSRSKMAKARSTLASMQLNALLLKR